MLTKFQKGTLKKLQDVIDLVLEDIFEKFKMMVLSSSLWLLSL